MKFVRPIGTSKTGKEGDGFKRRLRPSKRGDGATPQETVDPAILLVTDPRLLIGQYISMIDKIFRKHKSLNAMSLAGYEARNALGAELFKCLEKRLTDAKTEFDRDWLVAMWGWKIHPYGDMSHEINLKDLKKQSDDKRAANLKKMKGRWYETFVGDGDPPKDVSVLAAAIEDHLFSKERTLSAQTSSVGFRNRRIPGTLGLSQARALAIFNSVQPVQAVDVYPEDLLELYLRPDLAKAVYDLAASLEKQKYSKRIGRKDLGELMFRHYADIGLALPTADQPAQAQELRELHNDVKTFYRRIILGSKRGAKGMQRVSTRLPSDKDEFIKRFTQVRENTNMSRLMREGRLIYYANMMLPPETSVEDTAVEAAYNHYASSEGQASIQRAEAFIRVWRTLKDKAGRTAKDWVDPDGTDIAVPERRVVHKRQGQDGASSADEFINDDIMTSSTIELATKYFCEVRFDRKASLLFGSSAEAWTTREAKKKILHAVLTTLRRLRNEVTHFNTRGRFLQKLKTLVVAKSETTETGAHIISDVAAQHLMKMLVDDRAKLRRRIVEDAKGVSLHKFMNQDELKAHIKLASSPIASDLVLPSFKRLLKRFANTCNHLEIDDEETRANLPPPPTSEAMETVVGPARHKALNTLYQNAFGAWLKGCEGDKFKSFVDQALREARLLAAAMPSKMPNSLIMPKADILHAEARKSPKLFFNELQGLIDRTNRDQDAYEASPAKARKASEWVENIKLDVMTIAFANYLQESRQASILVWDQPSKGLSTETLEGFSTVEPNEPSDEVSKSPDLWQAALYAVLHLVPSNDVARLRHQMQKTSVLDKKSDGENGADGYQELDEILSLRLMIRDAKFTGASQDLDTELASAFFEEKEDFKRVFPTEGDDTTFIGLKRELRELARFGHLKSLEKLLIEKKITPAQVNNLLKVEASVAAKSKERKDLHEGLIKGFPRTRNKEASVNEVNWYAVLVRQLSEYSHLVADVRLRTHHSVHDLMMSVYSRITDFAGSWERDRTFVYLALLSRQAKREGRSGRLANGEDLTIKCKEFASMAHSGFWVSAPERLLDAKDCKTFELHFGHEKAMIRNNFAHHNPLSLREDDVNLTEYMNEVRLLMSYDRKQKNRVSRSIKTLLEREGLEVSWAMEDHRLKLKTVKSGFLQHLKDVKLPKEVSIREDRLSKLHVSMVTSLFGPS